MKVFVYCNLHKRCWSIQDQKTKRVILHTDRLTLTNAVFKVSEPGRQRVLRERRKNVHAGVVGEWDPTLPPAQTVGETAITYDPYKYATFVTRRDFAPVSIAASVTFVSPKNVWI